MTTILKIALPFLSASLAASFPSYGKTVTDTYRFKMTLSVPRVYVNTNSLGYRKYQRQTITGIMYITYDDAVDGPAAVSFGQLVNQKHMVSGTKVTYTAATDENIPVKVNVVGNNKTGEFRTASVKFGMIAEPSFAIGPVGEDNSLYITLAGSGRTTKIGKARVIRRLSGSVAGAVGCSCSAYGHMSPTRVMGAFGATGMVDDVAATFGTWRAVRLYSQSR